jgi:hypothetical protein
MRGPVPSRRGACRGSRRKVEGYSLSSLVKSKAAGAKERVHLDDLKVFVPRTEMLQAAVNTVELHGWFPPEGAGARLSFDLEV